MNGGASREHKARAVAQLLLADGAGAGARRPSSASPRRPSIQRPPTRRGDAPPTRRDLDEARVEFNRRGPLLDAFAAAVHGRARERVPIEERPRADEPLSALVLELHRMLLAHPVAGRRLFAAFVAEGRHYARGSSEGRRLYASLLRSPRVADASRLLRALAQGMLDADAPSELPSSYVDNLMRIVDAGEAEALGASIFELLTEASR